VAEGKDLNTLLPERVPAGALETFPGVRLARCTYQFACPGKDVSSVCTAEVLFFQTAEPVDAFGIFSLFSRKRGWTIRWQDGGREPSASGSTPAIARMKDYRQWGGCSIASFLRFPLRIRPC